MLHDIPLPDLMVLGKDVSVGYDVDDGCRIGKLIAACF
jgi:hypothetical protein